MTSDAAISTPCFHSARRRFCARRERPSVPPGRPKGLTAPPRGAATPNEREASVGAVLSALAVIFVEHPVLGGQECRRGESGNRNEEDPRHRRGVSHPEVAESFLVKIERVEQRRIDWPACSAGDDERRGE